jgi:membrane protease YdiL (CAAX protease family)
MAASVALAVAGPIVHAWSWWLIRSRRASIWLASGVTLGPLGVVAVLVGPTPITRRFGVLVAVGLGVLAGVALWLATLAFMALVAGRAPALARHTSALYGERGNRSLLAALAVPLLLSAPGEELLWRGVVLGVLARAVDSVPAAVLTWAAFVIVNVVSGSLPIVLGAVVGGAVWTWLAWWTGGVVASIACHVVWTGLMIALPPRAGGR